MPLTDRQALFCEEYCRDLNASRAALRAGYAKNGHGQTGHTNLKNPEIQARIEEIMDARAADTEVLRKRVVMELTTMSLAEADPDTSAGRAILAQKKGAMACTGEPGQPPQRRPRLQVYPRVYGGTRRWDTEPGGSRSAVATVIACSGRGGSKVAARPL